jgi:hypothetical protein
MPGASNDGAPLVLPQRGHGIDSGCAQRRNPTIRCRGDHDRASHNTNSCGSAFFSMPAYVAAITTCAWLAGICAQCKGQPL